jgi:hypothetical protein
MSDRGVSEQQASPDGAALEDWLRSRGGQPWFEGIVLECVERFPRLDRFQVTAVILKLRDENSAELAAEQSREWIKQFGVDFGSMSEEELTTVVRMHRERMGREGT